MIVELLLLAAATIAAGDGVLYVYLAEDGCRTIAKEMPADRAKFGYATVDPDTHEVIDAFPTHPDFGEVSQQCTRGFEQVDEQLNLPEGHDRE